MLSKPVFTWANLITVVGLGLGLLSIILACADYWQLAAIIFAVAALSDAVDGYVARRLDAIGKLGSSELGKKLDPLRDRVLGLIVFPLASVGEINLWFPAIFVFINAGLVLWLSWLITRFYGVVTILPLSKALTVVEFFLLCCWLLGLVLGLVPSPLAWLLMMTLLYLAVARAASYCYQLLFGNME